MSTKEWLPIFKVGLSVDCVIRMTLNYTVMIDCQDTRLAQAGPHIEILVVISFRVSSNERPEQIRLVAPALRAPYLSYRFGLFFLSFLDSENISHSNVLPCPVH